ncbi:MAG: hypothetical protein Q8L68_07075 [Methylococcales bacterium]|nr:hypothetical protein [Methylococcales bacterium]
MEVILLISPEPWNDHFVSKHHYAITLASRGYKAYFLGPPESKLSKIEIKETTYNNLWVISALIVAKGLRFYPAQLRRWLEARWLAKLEQQIGSSFSTIWLFENSRFFDLSFADNRLKIYHQVDLNQDFHVPEAASSADICFCTTDFIKKKIIPYNDNVYKIHHGVSIPLKNPPFNGENKCFENYKINAVYVGNIDISYLDIALLLGLINQFSNVQFHFIGKYKEDGELYNRCFDSKNITWWGQVASEIIPTILIHSDIQLLVYKVDSEWEMEQLASPHKVMEYLNSGKVTVATYTDEYKDKRHLLEMVDDSKDFFATFEKVINDLPFYNSPEKQAERVAFAQNNTYSKQLDTIMTYLKRHNLHL